MRLRRIGGLASHDDVRDTVLGDRESDGGAADAGDGASFSSSFSSVNWEDGGVMGVYVAQAGSPVGSPRGEAREGSPSRRSSASGKLMCLARRSSRGSLLGDGSPRGQHPVPDGSPVADIPWDESGLIYVHPASPRDRRRRRAAATAAAPPPPASMLASIPRVTSGGSESELADDNSPLRVAVDVSLPPALNVSERTGKLDSPCREVPRMLSRVASSFSDVNWNWGEQGVQLPVIVGRLRPDDRARQAQAGGRRNASPTSEAAPQVWPEHAGACANVPYAPSLVHAAQQRRQLPGLGRKRSSVVSFAKPLGQQGAARDETGSLQRYKQAAGITDAVSEITSEDEPPGLRWAGASNGDEPPPLQPARRVSFKSDADPAARPPRGARTPGSIVSFAVPSLWGGVDHASSVASRGLRKAVAEICESAAAVNAAAAQPWRGDADPRQVFVASRPLPGSITEHLHRIADAGHVDHHALLAVLHRATMNHALPFTRATAHHLIAAAVAVLVAAQTVGADPAVAEFRREMVANASLLPRLLLKRLEAAFAKALAASGRGLDRAGGCSLDAVAGSRSYIEQVRLDVPAAARWHQRRFAKHASAGVQLGSAAIPTTVALIPPHLPSNVRVHDRPAALPPTAARTAHPSQRSPYTQLSPGPWGALALTPAEQGLDPARYSPAPRSFTAPRPCPRQARVRWQKAHAKVKAALRFAGGRPAASGEGMEAAGADADAASCYTIYGTNQAITVNCPYVAQELHDMCFVNLPVVYRTHPAALSPHSGYLMVPPRTPGSHALSACSSAPSSAASVDTPLEP